MGLYDTFRNRKPKAGTVFLICSKWFEDGTQMLFGDTASVVLNLDDDGIFGLLGRHGDGSVRGSCIGSISQKI